MTGALNGDTTNRLTWWEGEGVSVECRRQGAGFIVRTLRGGQTSGEIAATSDTRAREIFERVVERLVNGESLVS